jgi:hypothetical protein
MACTDEGAFGFADSMITVCKGGSMRFAVPDDVPPAPSGGYTSRPDWYPPLASIFGQLVDECTAGPVRFTHPFLPLDHITRSIPYGAMIRDHVTPIDHAYIGIDTLDTPVESRTDADFVPITSPADGVIVDASKLGDPGSHRVVIVHGCGVVSVYMVVNRLTGVLASIADGVDRGEQFRGPIPIKAGEEFGRQRDNALDFNTFDSTAWLAGLANPFSYAEGEAWKPYTSDPSSYFSPDIASALEATLQRTASPRWGSIDHDVVGSAAGSWFLDGTLGYNGISVSTAQAATQPLGGQPVADKKIYSYGHLSLSPEPVDPNAWIFSTGTWSDPAGDGKQLLIVPGDSPLPNTLTASSGVVVYQLATIGYNQPAGFVFTPGAPFGIGYTVTAGQTEGWLVVQVVDDHQLAAEVVVGASRPTGFTAARQTYHR